MKKIYLGLILLFAFSLTACLGPKQYKYSLSNSKVNSSVVLTARGNKLIKYTADTKIDYSNDKKAAEISAEDARKALKQKKNVVKLHSFFCFNQPYKEIDYSATFLKRIVK